ncbi:MAG: nucleotidyltransferase family protein [Gammaproteobacteria bacterium]|nr:nucleotidyltransferase family protein [Gammaproteobacteria bacterium]MBU2435863.1 nucleotidyltransferase family protein [Gammaproteobacteria bacterium]MBU2449356.1 nucleotidyltransferase family protein [Gammaproteobacteria bacterium]
MIERDFLLRALLTEPTLLLSATASQWDLLIRQARSANLLARLANHFVEANLLEIVPQAPRQHLISALRLVDRQNIAMRWEIDCIRKAVADIEMPVILLKGAAYVLAELSSARGRLFSDVDILVPKHRLADVESGLMLHGWRSLQYDEYDQRYYRRWMHEIPPMRHVRRGTVIDVHHSILPPTARVKVNTEALLAAAMPLAGHNSVYMLQPTDMFLHSATHLFHEGEFEKGLRDLFDLDSLLREFGCKDCFWEKLVPRALELGLARPLFYALRYTNSILGTPIPSGVLKDAMVARPRGALLHIMDFCYMHALRPVHSSTDETGTRLARFALYLRSHWLRMPLHLLAYHLGRKALIRDNETTADGNAPNIWNA